MAYWTNRQLSLSQPGGLEGVGENIIKDNSAIANDWA